MWKCVGALVVGMMLVFEGGGPRMLCGGSGLEKRVGWQVRALRGHRGKVTSIAFSRDGKQIVCGSEDKLVEIWDVETGAEVGILECPLRTVR